MNNLDVCDLETKKIVLNLLNHPATRNLTRDTIRSGLKADSLDAMRDAETAAAALRRVYLSISGGAELAASAYASIA